MEEFDPVTLEILWERLITIVDEGAISLRNTAFSLLVREGNDFAVVLLDPEGNAVAQNRASLPCFTGTIPPTVKYLVKAFRGTWQPGDVAIINDPWLSAGHVNDLTVVTPIFGGDGVAGFTANTAHAADIGGLRYGGRGHDMYEEGLRIPALKLYTAGEPNKVLFDMIRANVRLPDHVLGDIEAQVSANETASRKLKELLAEFDIKNLTSLTSAILSRSEAVMRTAIDAVPEGSWSHQIIMDGVGDPITIRVTITVKGDDINADYSGTSPQVNVPLNSVPNYTYAYTAYPIRAALCPGLPNNDGVLRPITVTAPPGCLVNPLPPAPVGLRNITGHFFAEAVYGALVQVVPDKVVAGSGSGPAPSFFVHGERQDGSGFADMFFCAGGMGARPTMDGLSTVMFPANVGAIPVEILEHTLPILYEEKEFLPNSAGQGEYRGGLGARHRFTAAGSKGMWISAVADRTKTPAGGLSGAKPGTLFRMTVNGTEVPTKDFIPLQEGDTVTIEVPGGGGYGHPENRRLDLIEKDREEGLVTG